MAETLDAEELIVEGEESEEDEPETPVTYDIAAYPSDLTLSVLKDMWDNQEVEIPPYQRNFVWKIKQSSLLIESFLLGLPVPQVFFYVDTKNKYQVIDGHQRLMTIVYYLEGYFGSESIQGKKQVFRLRGLSPKSPYFNKRFEDLDEVSQRKLKGAVLRVINVRQLSPKGEATSAYHIFERLNTGGTPLKPQEIRNVVLRGPIVPALHKLNRDPNWRQIIGKRHLDRHQKDVELLLRVFALWGYFDKYEKPMKEFLSTYMGLNRDAASPKFKRFVKLFPKAAAAIVHSLGEKPFHVRGPLNSSALDAVFATLLAHVDKLPKDLPKRYSRLLKDRTFKGDTNYSTSDSTVIHRRFKVVKTYLID